MPSSSPSPASNSALPARPWVQRIPWASLAVLLGSGLYLRLFYHLPGRLDDEGLILASADRILQGQIPYRDFFSELAPGSFYLEAAIFKLLGTNLDSFRLTAWLVGVLTTWLLYSLSKRILTGAAAFLPALLFVTICYAHNYAVSHHWWGNLFFLLTVACLAAYAAQTLAPGGWWQKLVLFTAGLLAGAALLSMQTKSAWAILMGIAFLLLAEKMRTGSGLGRALRNGLALSLWFLAGVAILLGLAVGYFWAHRALGEWYFDNVVFLFTNYWSYETAPHAYSWERFTHLMSYLFGQRTEKALLYVTGYYFFAVVGPLVAFGGTIRQLLPSKSPQESQARLLVLYLLGGLAAFVSEIHAPDMNHLLWASPIMLILLVYSCQCGLRGWRRLRWPLVVGTLVAIVFVVLVARRELIRAAEASTPVLTRRGTFYADPQTAAALEEWVKVIETAVPPHQVTFFFPYKPQLYFFTATRNPTRYDVLLPDFHSAWQIEEALGALKARQPAHVFSLEQRWAVRADYPDAAPNISEEHPVEKVLRGPESSYRLAAEVAGLEVWVLKR